ncbi:hypothetical protein Ga0061061_101166 [Chelatococcus sambhunathii]|uniref:Membrane protein involved in the export of O-antigen and teichoic acid n=1 Tax=Chelatococcus sambhunathii TaxID=363953 RepID=A0ABP1ZY98_9HYPH|nr:hypothetical protein Ga0061061_101166 [Chelatococcus sambhunathii]
MHAPVSLGSSLLIFASGRLAAVALGFAFQLLVVRVLPLADYAGYAVAMAAALLAQSLLLFGVPTVLAYEASARHHAGDGPGLRRLLGRVAAVRLGVLALFALVAFLASAGGFLPALAHGVLIAAAVVWAAGLLLASDAESICQVLGQQRLSRAVAVGEPLVRLAALVTAVGLGWPVEAATVVMLCAATTALAGLALVGAAAVGVARLGAMSGSGQTPRQNLVALAGASYLSTAGAMVMSPPAVRLAVSGAMPVELLAAFSFMQGLMLSFLRLTSGIVLSPFIEPAVMSHAARAGSQAPMAAALSLVFKLDLVVFSTAVVGLLAGGPAVLALLAGGRFAGLDWLLPVLFVLPPLYGFYRSLETAAAVMARRRALATVLPIGLFWLGMLILTGLVMPLVAALVIPILDIGARLLLLAASLRRSGVRGICDLPFLLVVVASALIVGMGARLMAADVMPAMQILVAALAALVHLAVVLGRARRLPAAEHAIVAAAMPRLLRFLPASAGREAVP